MIKAILFDLDNTLIDFIGLKNHSCIESIKAMIKYGLKIDEKKAYNILFSLYDKHGIEYNKIFQKFVSKINSKIDYNIISAGIVAYRVTQKKNMKTYKNVIPTLKKLKRKYKLGIVSDAPTLKVWIRIHELKIVDYFDIVVARNSKIMKPHKFPFNRAISKLKIKPKNILFVGDKPHRDIKGAKLIGMKTALAEYGLQDCYKKYLKNNKPDFVLKSINDIFDVLKNI